METMANLSTMRNKCDTELSTEYWRMKYLKKNGNVDWKIFWKTAALYCCSKTVQFIFKLSVHKDYDKLNRLRYWVSADTEINVHLYVMLWKTSLKDAPASSKELLDIQAIIECGFTLKRIRDMTRTYSHW